VSVEAPPSTLLIDDRLPSDQPLRHVWSECLGAGRANEALRADWQGQFREAVRVLGARHVRFHGVFHDDMFVYRASNGGGFGPPTPLAEPVYTYAYVDKVFDAILPDVTSALEDAARGGAVDTQQLQQVVRRVVGRWASNRLRRRPMIIPVVVEA